MTRRVPSIPFSHAHDHERAGLRDYRAPVEQEPKPTWPRWMALAVVAVALLGIYGLVLWQYAHEAAGGAR